MDIQVVQGDITTFEVDIIVNAANRALSGGGGVDGAIHRAAGPDLLAECRTLGICQTGQAKITKAYQLSAQHVIHAVGPVWKGGDYEEEALLASCYREALVLADRHEATSIAFPSISCGAYRFPVEQAADIAIQIILEHAKEGQTTLQTIYLVCFEDKTFRAFSKAYEKHHGQ